MALRGGLNIDPNQLPAFGLQVAAPDKPSPIVGGLASGIHELLGLGGSALQGVGAIVDAPDVQDYGKQVAANQNATAQRVGRPDLEVAPWQAGGASIAPWLLYQGAKLAPTLAGYAAATALAPEAAVPAGLARIGATLPEFLGGAGLEAGANFAARRAALEAGTGFGKFVVGGGAFGGVTGFGQAIQSADQKPGGVDQGDAAQALAESPLYAAAGLMEPGFLRGALAGAEGKLVTRVAARALSGGAVGAVQSGVMAGLDQTFRPDLSSQDKFSNIVDAAMTGAAVGGMFGGLTGIRALKRADPNAVLADPDALGKTIDTVLALPAPTAFTDAAGRTVVGSGGDAVLRATPGEQSPLDLTPDNAMQLPQLQLGGPPVIANDLGQAAVGSEGGAAVRATPADIGFRLTDIPQAEPALPGPGPDRTAVDGSTIVVGRRDETGRFTNKATGVEQPPVVPDDTSRSFRNFTDAELTSASNALANKHEAHGLDKDQQLLRQKIDEELNFRNKSLTSDKAQSEVAGAVQRADQGEQGAGDQSSAAPAPANTPKLDIKFTRSGVTGKAVDGLQLIGDGSESTVYRSGDKVIKVAEPYNDKSDSTFAARIQQAQKIDQLVGDGTLKVIGHYESANGTKNPVFEQSHVEGRPATQAEIDAHMAERGFAKSADGRSYIKTENGTEYTISDVDKDNVIVDRKGQTHVIDAALKEKPTGSIADRITELTQGLRVPASLKEKLAQARSENDIQDIVHDQAIVQGKGGVTVDALGKRTGVLDDTGKPTTLADEISARKTEPGEQPASPTFQAEWKTDIQSVGQKDPIVRSLNPVNREDAMLQLYRALGNYDETRDTTDRSGVEKLAQKYGVLDENKKLTPAAVQLAERDPIPVEDAKAAAEAQGLKGGMSTMFAKGVAAYTGEGPEMRVPNADRAAAYQAGFHWAEEHNSVPKGALKQYVGREVTDKDVAAVEGKAPKPQVREVPPEVRQAQQVNEAIDNANLQPAKREGDIASLKRMVREGDIQGAMEGLRRVQRGDSLFEQPERAPSEPFKGARVDATSRALAGSRDKAQAELDHQRDAAGMIKEVTKAEAEQAIRKYELTQAIEHAHGEGSIDDRERLSMINSLRQGKIGDVMAKLPFVEPDPRRSPIVAANLAARKARISDLLEALQKATAESEVPELQVDKNGVLKQDQVKLARRDFLAGLAAAAATGLHEPARALPFTPASKGLADLIKGDGGINGSKARPILEYLKANSSDPAYRMIAAKLLRGIDGKAWDGVDVRYEPYENDEARGTTTLNDDGTSSVVLFGKDGLNEQTALHELIHAYVQQRWGALRAYGADNKELLKDKVERHDAKVAEWRILSDKIGKALEKASPGITDREVWAGAMTESSDEMLSWTLTNPDAQAFLKSIDTDGNKISPEKPASQKTMWDHIVDWVRNLFGLPSTQRTALSDVLSAGYSLLDAGADVKTGDFNVKLALEMRRERLSQDMRKTPNTPPEMSRKTQDTVSSVVDAVDRRVDLEGARGVLRRGQLYATSIHHITEFFGKPWFGTKVGDRDVNGVVEREQHTDFREAVQQRNAQLLTDVMDRAYALEHGDRKSFENINFVQQASEYGINPTRGWDQQTEEVRANLALKDKWQEFSNAYRSLQKKGHAGIYDDLRKFNDVLMLAQTSMSLHDHVATDKITAGRFDAFSQNPMRRFMNEQAREGHGLDGAHDFWNGHIDTQVEAMESYIKQMERSPPPTLSGADKRAMRIGIGTMRDQIKTINKIREDLDNVPNFHLGRDGDYFVNMRLRLGEDGKVDPKALADAAERLSQFGSLNKVVNRVISTVPDSRNDQSHVYIRVDNTVAQANLLKIAKQLQKEGIVRTDVEKDGTKTYGVIAGKRTDDRIRNALGGQWSDRLVSEIAANPHIKPEDRKMLETMIRAQALDLMPDNSLAKMATHREGVPGYNPDMLRSFNNRAKVTVDALAGMTVARDMTEAYANMRAAIKERQGNPDTPMAQRNGMTEVVDELSKHDKDFANAPRGSKPLNQLQATSGAFFLSANLAYPMVNLVQVPMVALPELGKKFGFIKSAKTLASVTPEALKIIRAIGQTGLRVSKARAADATLTTEALRKAGISKEKSEFLMQVANRGGIDIGGQSREMSRNANGLRGDKVDQGLRIASALGYYSETLSRLVVALASYHLHPEGADIDRMVGNTVHTLKESMWDYSSPNTSRMLGRSGFLGPLTPLATQFMKYTAMLNEKLYREVHAAVGGDKEAARFLAGHLAMTTVFAGALGLPFAGVFASAYDRLKDLFDQGDEPSDIQASFRNGMADMFGKNAAEIIARGAPRAAGIDLSTRIGEQDILPFSKFIEDRRGLKDSLKDLESRAWGAPSSMMLNMATGAQRVAQGDLTGGIRQMLPLGLAGMVKSYQMTTQGYTDSKGNVLPMTPSAGAVLAQALGFNPAMNAEYNEARQDQVVRQGLLSRQSQQMRNNIADAIIGGDRDKARELITQAQAFDKANPAYGVLQGVEGSIQRRRQGSAVAARLGTPLGISPKDRYAPQFTHYANIDYQAQR